MLANKQKKQTAISPNAEITYNCSNNIQNRNSNITNI